MSEPSDDPPRPARSPLAYDKAGVPIELDPSCVAFRVVYDKPGPPTAVPAPLGGPLMVFLATTIEELRAQTGAGKFKLVQIDDDANEIEGAVTAYMEFGQRAPTKPGNAGPDVQQLLAAVLESNKQLRESHEALSKALAGAVNSLAGNGLKPEKAKDKDTGDEEPELDPIALAEKWGPLVMMIKGMWDNAGALPGGGGTNGSGK